MGFAHDIIITSILSVFMLKKTVMAGYKHTPTKLIGTVITVMTKHSQCQANHIVKLAVYYHQTLF